MEPQRIAALRRSALSSLAHGALHPGDARPYFSAWRELIAGYAAFDDAESRRVFRALLTYRACPRLSPVTRNKPLSDAPNAVKPGRPLELTDATVRIDDLCRAENIDRVAYIKMDIEGSEQAALDGASETIAKHRPELAICLYHKPADLWSIPAALKRWYPFYRLYLDHYSLHNEGTVMYAIA